MTFGMGHHLHWIGYNKLRPRTDWIPVVKLAVDGNWITVETDDGTVLHGWYHYSERLTDAKKEFEKGTIVSILPDLHYLSVGTQIWTLSLKGPTPCHNAKGDII